MFKGLLVLSVMIVSSMAVAQPSDVVKVGVVVPLSGPVAQNAISHRRGIEYAVKAVNDAGGIDIGGKKKPIKLIFGDSQSRPDIGVSAAQRLIARENVDLIAGDLVHSDVALAIMDTLAGTKTPVYVGGVSLKISEKIAAEPQKYSNVWKHLWSSDAYGVSVTAAVDLIVKQTPGVPKTVAIIGEDTGFSRPIVDSMMEPFKGSGINLVATEMVPISTTDFYPTLAKIRRANPGFVLSVFTATNTAVAFAKQLSEQGMKAVHMDIVGAGQEGFMEAAGKAADGIVTHPMLIDSINNPVHRDFASKFQEFSGLKETGVDAIVGYTMGCVLIDVLRRAKSTDIDAINKAFAETSVDCTFGTWAFNAANHSPKYGEKFLRLPVGQIQAGKRYLIWPEAIATSQYKKPQ